MIVRRLIVVVVALLIAAQVVRNAAVAMLAPLHPATAASIWAGHPSVETSLGLAQIGRASRERTKISPATFAMIDDAAAKAPLSAEPFLVRGVQAQLAGNTDEASRAFAAAQWRDPRSMPAAYFLAEYYIGSGRLLQGLEQTALLARLTPNGVDVVSSFIAAYAQSPANWSQMRELFRSHADLEDGVLMALAHNSGNASAILAIADAAHRRPDSPWLPVLLQSLIGSRDYARAHAVWSSVGRGNAGGYLIYDSNFSSPQPPPPFNWTFASSTVGLAERQPGKRLHAIFYGSDDGVLASQLLLLRPGTYRMEMQLLGTSSHPEALSWSVRCDKTDAPFAAMPIEEAASRGWNFAVPANCPAQWLELSARSGDVTQQSDVTIGPLTLVRTSGHD